MKKKTILKEQYKKSLETVNLIKKYMITVMESVDCKRETLWKLKNAALTEENISLFLGILETKGIVIVKDYANLVAEKIKLEK